MRTKILKLTAIAAVIVMITSIFASCGKKTERIEDVISTAETVLINGKEETTVEARAGAFRGKQGDYIEFKFPEPQVFNTIFITEKTTSVRQFNIFAEVDGKYKLVYTGKNIFAENIYIEPVTATGFKLQIVNTDIGNDDFIIQGITAYNIEDASADGSNQWK